MKKTPEKTAADHGLRVGIQGTYQPPTTGPRVNFVVTSIDGNLAWAKYDNYPGEAMPFIWRFSSCLNERHDWPGKTT